MSYPYHMALWDRWMLSRMRRKIAAERLAAALAAMKPGQLRLQKPNRRSKMLSGLDNPEMISG